MLIILEGVDGVGKSTLAGDLAAALPIDEEVVRLHAEPLETDALTAYERPLDFYAPGTRTHVVCDRHHLGELVYGPLLRGESRLSRAERVHVDLYLRSRGAVVLHLTAPRDILRERLGTRGDDLIGPEHLDRLTDTYYRVINGLYWTTPTYHVHDDTGQGWGAEEVLRIIGAGAKFEYVAAMATWRFHTYAGPPRPDFLFLGERRRTVTYDHEPAFTPAAATSGRYLLTALPPDCLINAGLANACEENLAELWPALGRPKVVALGREAERECRTAEIPHGSAPHPQYVRRFHHGRRLEYGRLLREALIYGRDMSRALSDTRT